jgi:hypothetical protein
MSSNFNLSNMSSLDDLHSDEDSICIYKLNSNDKLILNRLRERKSSHKRFLSHDDIRPVEIKYSYNKIKPINTNKLNHTDNDIKMDIKIKSKYQPEIEMTNIDENIKETKSTNTFQAPQFKKFLIRSPNIQNKCRTIKNLTKKTVDLKENTNSILQLDNKIEKKFPKYSEKMISKQDNIFKNEFKLKTNNSQLKILNNTPIRKKNKWQTGIVFNNFDDLNKFIDNYKEKEDKQILPNDTVFNKINKNSFNENININKNNYNNKNDNNDIYDNEKNINTNLRSKYLKSKSKDPKGCACMIF